MTATDTTVKVRYTKPAENPLKAPDDGDDVATFSNEPVTDPAEGRSVREIAGVTGWTPGYVRFVLTRIYAKPGVSGQVALVARVVPIGAMPRG